MSHVRTIGDTHSIQAVLSTAPAGVTVLAPLSSADEILLTLVHSTSGTTLELATTADAISGSETGACSTAIAGNTFSEVGTYVAQYRVTWGANVRHYPEAGGASVVVRAEL